MRGFSQVKAHPPSVILIPGVGFKGTIWRLARFRALIQTDAELSEILMRAFILRRVALLSSGFGDVIVIGSRDSAATLRLQEFLVHNGHPCRYVDVDRDPDVQTILDEFHVAVTDIPILICRGDVVLRNPTNAEAADCLDRVGHTAAER